MKNKYGVILLIIIMLFTGCSNNSMISIYNDKDKIASSTNSYNLIDTTQTIKENNFTGRVEKIEGMDTIWTYEADEDMSLDITYLLNVTKGKVKLVLISPDNSLTDIIERSSKASLTDFATSTMQIKKGLNRIKMVAGKDCSVEFDITISCGKFKELGM